MKNCEKCGKPMTPNGPYCFSCWNCASHNAVVPLGNGFVQVLAQMDWYDMLRVVETISKKREAEGFQIDDPFTGEVKRS